ncbi:MAG: hypothetical protein SNG02_02700 [Rikenellaceae bacterium]
MSYFKRAFKYFALLCITYFAMVYGMSFTGLMVLTPEETFMALVSSSRGIVMIVAILALSFSYPVFGFMRQEVSGDMQKHREQIMAAFAANSFKLVSEQSGEMVFGCDNFIKKITFLYEDKITVSQVGDKLVLEGIRRAVPYIIYRLEGSISFAERGEE